MWERLILLIMVIWLSELLKKTNIVNSKFIPLLNIILAQTLNLFYKGFGINEMYIGLILGIGATGVYSSCKNLFEGIKKRASQK